MQQATWLKISPSNLKLIPDVIGVYVIGNTSKKTIYIGEGRIKDRVKAHVKNPKFTDAAYFMIEVTNSKRRAQQRERALHRAYIKKYNTGLPKHNTHLGGVNQ